MRNKDCLRFSAPKQQSVNGRNDSVRLARCKGYLSSHKTRYFKIAMILTLILEGHEHKKGIRYEYTYQSYDGVDTK